MQSMEAIISLLILLWIFSFIMTDSVQSPMDDSLYRYQLVNDVWRVAYLRGDLKDLDLASGNPAHDNLTADLNEIESLTGLCAYFSGVRATSCPGQPSTIRIGSINKAVYENSTLVSATLMVAKSD